MATGAPDGLLKYKLRVFVFTAIQQEDRLRAGNRGSCVNGVMGAATATLRLAHPAVSGPDAAMPARVWKAKGVYLGRTALA